MKTFRAFTATHAAVVLAIVAITGAAIVAGRRRLRRDARPGPVERGLGVAYLAAWLTTYAWLLQAPHHDPARTYPLHLCHLTALAATVLLITGWFWLRPIVYFWGITLCTQALITPALNEGPALYPFWFFWVTHGLIIGVAAYDVGARDYRPSWRDLRFALGAAAGYVALILPLDLVFGWNYGFVGPSRPEVRTIVDLLGPWPWRLGPMFAIVAAAMFIAFAPWEILRRLRRRP